MPNLAPPDGADPTALSHAGWREVVLEIESLAVLAVECLERLPADDVADIKIVRLLL